MLVAGPSGYANDWRRRLQRSRLLAAGRDVRSGLCIRGGNGLPGLTFDGASHLVHGLFLDGFDWDTQAQTIFGWVRIDGAPVGGVHTFIANTAGGLAGKGWRFVHEHGSDNIFMQWINVWPGKTYSIQTTAASGLKTAGDYVWIGVTKPGGAADISGAKLFIQGEEVARTVVYNTAHGGTTTSGQQLTVGCLGSAAPSWRLNGALASMHVVMAELSPDQMREAFRGRGTFLPAAPSFKPWLSGLPGESPSVVPDLSDNGYDGSPVGAGLAYESGGPLVWQGA